jgi:hypothetical protein
LKLTIRIIIFCLATWLVWRTELQLDHAIASAGPPPRPGQQPDAAVDYLQTEHEFLTVAFWAIVGGIGFMTFAGYLRRQANKS